MTYCNIDGTSTYDYDEMVLKLSQITEFIRHGDGRYLNWLYIDGTLWESDIVKLMAV